MPARRPTLFLDTNVCDRLINPPFAGKLLGLLATIRKRYQIAVSPETVIELLRTLKGGSGEYFTHDQKRFRACICGDHHARFMGLPGEFAMKHALGLSVPAKFGADQFKHTVRIILAAKSRRELFETGVPTGKHKHVFNTKVNDEQHEEGLASHRDWLKAITSQQYIFPPPDRWGVNFARSLDVKIDNTQGAALAEGLSAHYAYQKVLFEKAKSNPNLNLNKRSGDWVDGQQLIYLSDRNVHFATADKLIKEWASASEQSERIFVLDDFIRGLEG